MDLAGIPMIEVRSDPLIDSVTVSGGTRCFKEVQLKKYKWTTLTYLQLIPKEKPMPTWLSYCNAQESQSAKN